MSASQIPIQRSIFDDADDSSDGEVYQSLSKNNEKDHSKLFSIATKNIKDEVDKNSSPTKKDTVKARNSKKMILRGKKKIEESVMKTRCPTSPDKKVISIARKTRSSINNYLLNPEKNLIPETSCHTKNIFVPVEVASQLTKSNSVENELLIFKSVRSKFFDDINSEEINPDDFLEDEQQQLETETYLSTLVNVCNKPVTSKFQHFSKEAEQTSDMHNNINSSSSTIPGFQPLPTQDNSAAEEQKPVKLTPAQKAKIEQNRQKALLIRQNKKNKYLPPMKK